jgi:3-hydroxybutyryl-CoA dehydrogenase
MTQLLEPVGIVGAGTMGAGIAQVAALSGAEVLLYDIAPDRLDAARDGIARRLRRLADAGRIPAADAPRIRFCTGLSDLAGCVLIIEAAAESMPVKAELLGRLEQLVPASCILASNTSSLSITALAAGLSRPDRCCGMHFFNPATAMPLVEVISGTQTAPAVADAVVAAARDWGKTPIRCFSSPGFIVNRVARPYYGEAQRLVEEGAATPATVDRILTGAAGFPMGPFALTDLVGQDVSLAVATSIWQDTYQDPRYAPTRLQRDLVDAGRLGRKSGRGVYEYGESTDPVAAPATDADAELASAGVAGLAGAGVAELAGAPLSVAAADLPCGARLMPTDGRTATATAALLGRPVVLLDLVGDRPALVGVAVSDDAPDVALAEAGAVLGREVVPVDDVPGLVAARTVAMLVNEAVDLVGRGVATSADVDVAMRLGTGYPLGPVEWGDRLGAAVVVHILDQLHAAYPTGRYRVTPRLRRAALSDGPLSAYLQQGA